MIRLLGGQGLAKRIILGLVYWLQTATFAVWLTAGQALQHSRGLRGVVVCGLAQLGASLIAACMLCGLPLEAASQRLSAFMSASQLTRGPQLDSCPTFDVQTPSDVDERLET